MYTDSQDVHLLPVGEPSPRLPVLQRYGEDILTPSTTNQETQLNELAGAQEIRRESQREHISQNRGPVTNGAYPRVLVESTESGGCVINDALQRGARKEFGADEVYRVSPVVTDTRTWHSRDQGLGYQQQAGRRDATRKTESTPKYYDLTPIQPVRISSPSGTTLKKADDSHMSDWGDMLFEDTRRKQVNVADYSSDDEDSKYRHGGRRQYEDRRNSKRRAGCDGNKKYMTVDSTLSSDVRLKQIEGDRKSVV
jgi:hypothetical protein